MVELRCTVVVPGLLELLREVTKEERSVCWHYLDRVARVKRPSSNVLTCTVLEEAITDVHFVNQCVRRCENSYHLKTDQLTISPPAVFWPR